jgi:hypothetical protein
VATGPSKVSFQWWYWSGLARRFDRRVRPGVEPVAVGEQGADLVQRRGAALHFSSFEGA